VAPSPARRRAGTQRRGESWFRRPSLAFGQGMATWFVAGGWLQVEVCPRSGHLVRLDGVGSLVGVWAALVDNLKDK